jgi:two-component system sensor histidine kinase VicK
MLTIAEIDRGTLTLKLSEVDLAPIFRHVCDEMARQYPAVPLDAHLPDTLIAPADPVRISEVVRQLLDNACRYSPEGQTVQVRARMLDEGIVVSVTDRGVGMPRDLVAQVFNEPFSTGEETLRKERAGAGVGLHMARQLILQHGGIIWADPLPGGGTRVSFCLPGLGGAQITSKPELAAEGTAGEARAGDDPRGRLGQSTSTVTSS